MNNNHKLNRALAFVDVALVAMERAEDTLNTTAGMWPETSRIIHSLESFIESIEANLGPEAMGEKKQAARRLGITVPVGASYANWWRRLPIEKRDAINERLRASRRVPNLNASGD